MPRSHAKISDTVVSGIRRAAFSSRSASRWSCWLQPVHVQHSQVFCLLQAFQNVNHFQQIFDHIWSVRYTLLFALHSLHRPWKPSEYRILSAYNTHFFSLKIRGKSWMRVLRRSPLSVERRRHWTSQAYSALGPRSQPRPVPSPSLYVPPLDRWCVHHRSRSKGRDCETSRISAAQKFKKISAAQ